MAASSGSQSNVPTCLIVLGMAGSGKTTFVNQLTKYLESNNKSVYTINLDPAVHHVPYHSNVGMSFAFLVFGHSLCS